MSRGKPVPPEHHYSPIYWLLKPTEQTAFRAAWGLTDAWEPPPQEPVSRERVLEGLDELARIMRWKPGYVGQLKEELINRVEREEGE